MQHERSVTYVPVIRSRLKGIMVVYRLGTGRRDRPSGRTGSMKMVAYQNSNVLVVDVGRS
jgi:hypothetical protein